MIIYCEKCNSKFKVDDAKIPPAGVMASCSVCSHRFHLKKEPNTPDIVELGSEAIVAQAAAASATPEPVRIRAEDTAASRIEKPATPKVATAALPTVPAAPPLPATAQTPSAATWDFSSFADEGNEALWTEGSGIDAAESVFEVVTEIEESDGSPEIVAEIEDADDLANVFSSDSENGETSTAHKAFEDFLARQSAGTLSTDSDQVLPKPAMAREAAAVANTQAPPAAERELAGTTITERAGDTAPERESLASPRSERFQAEPAVDSTAASVAQHPVPEIIADRRKTSIQYAMPKSLPGIVSLLDERGLSEDYVVTRVQEACEATRYVEGVERPDWQTRILGLDILCKMRGLYPQEKKEEPGNRQVQIVAGINM